jgi:hypothetical protein
MFLEIFPRFKGVKYKREREGVGDKSQQREDVEY